MPIVLEHVTLRYAGTGPTTRPAVDDLSLVVEDGEYLGVIGHTGSGKSTLALLMAGLMTATAGTLTVNGADLAERSARRALRRQVGIVFQYPEHQLFADTVADDVAFGPRALGFSPAKVAHAVDEALQRVDMELCTYGHRSPFDLSEGQMRRVAIAGVLAARPGILILDEPMAGLDPAGRAEIATLLRRLHERGLTIVMVSHDMDDIASLADKVLVLRDGRRFAHGTPAEVFARQTELREIGLGVPHAARFAARLSARGIDVAAMVATPDALADALVASRASAQPGREL
jgi:energy-coupling factor transport system ATP-binding protein